MTLSVVLNIITWVMIWINFQFQMLNLALNDVHNATLAVGRGDIAEGHRLSRRAQKLRRFGYPLLWVLPQGKMLFW